MLAVKQASAVVQLGMIGIQDAVTAALDPSKPQAFAAALKNLSPNARAFATEVSKLQPDLKAFQQGVQNRLFAGFADELRRLATSVLPVVQKGFNDTASTLNRMALGASEAARRLASNGTLGKALAGANTGLSNLSKVPVQVVTALGQLAAAGVPVFNRLTKLVAKVADGISDRLSKAFKSGALGDAVNTALDLVIDLGHVAANVFGAIQNILGSVSSSGAGFINILSSVSKAIEDVTATKAFQRAIGALAQTMAVIGRTVGPLLQQALSAIAPVFTALATPVQTLVQSLGKGLSAVLTGLAPVLASAARSVGALLTAISPLLPVLGNLIGALLPVLVPVFDALTTAFTSLTPAITQVARIIGGSLVPVITSLIPALTPIILAFGQWLAAMAPVVTQLLVALTPSLIQLGQSLGKLIVALTPLITLFAQGFIVQVQASAAIVQRFIPVVSGLASVLANSLAANITNLVVPALRLMSSVLRGDVSGSWNAAKALIHGAGNNIIQTQLTINRVTQAVFNAVRNIIATNVAGARIAAVAAFTRIRDDISSSLASARRTVSSVFNSLPGRIRAPLARAGGLLFSVGQDLIRGLIRGINSMFGGLISAVRSVVGSAVSTAKSLLQISSPSKVFAEIGRNVGLGFIKGLTGTQEQIAQTTANIAGSITQAFRGRTTNIDDRLVSLVQAGNKRLQTLAAERDALSKRIADAVQFAADTAAQARDAFSLASITQNGVSHASVLGGLEGGVAQIKRFTAQINALRKRGLRKDLLAQLIGLGPEQGAALANFLSQQTPATLKQINSLQAQVVKASASLGRLSADALFDAGKQAGKGFLTGLTSQRKQIEALMLSIAKSMQKAIKKALGIRSPSRVMAEVGQQATLGLAEGLMDRLPSVDKAVSGLFDSVAKSGQVNVAQAVSTVPVSTTTRVPAPAPTVVHVTIANQGVIGSQTEVLRWLATSIETLRKQRRLAF